MSLPSFSRLPRHVGFIPDGNRRWAEQRGLPRSAGYAAGIEPSWRLLQTCLDLGIQEVSVYGFTQDNAHRPRDQVQAFRDAAVYAVRGALERADISLLVVGDADSPLFPPDLLPYTVRQGNGGMRVNLLVNYGWDWDLQTALRAIEQDAAATHQPFPSLLGSAGVSRIDLIVRWGGRRRLSGFLPVQSVYADMYVLDALWPDYQPEQFYEALDWYQRQDRTLGG